MAATTMEDLAYLNLNSRRRLTRCSNLRNASTAKAAIQAITEAESSRLRCIDHESNDGGARQVKLVISKKELRQMVASMGWVSLRANDHKFTSAAGVEQFFSALRTKQLRREEGGCRGSSSRRWEPALGCIPEEF